MKKIQLLGAAPIAGKQRFPSEGPIELANEMADSLIATGLAVADDLDSQRVEDLRQVADAAGVPVGPAALKSEIIAAIRARRINKR